MFGVFKDDEKQELIKEFVTQGRELLDEVEPRIIEMERTAVTAGKVDEEILNAIFRLFHTLKGSASFLDLQTVTAVTHEAETLLDIFRRGKVVVKPEHVDLLCRTSDFIRNILDKVEQQLSDGEFKAGAEEIIGDLKQTITSVAVEDTAGSASGTPGERQAWIAGEEKAEGAGELTAPFDAGEITFEISPEMIRRFCEEALAFCDEAEAALLALEKTPGDLEYARTAFHALHSLKGNAGFFGYGDLEEISHHAETVLDMLRDGEKECDSVTTSFLLIAVDALREGVRQISSDTTLEIPGKKELLKHLGRMAMDSDAGSGRGRGQVKDSQEPTGFEEHLVGDPPNEDNTPARQQNPAMENETDGDDGRSGGEPKEKQSLSAQQQVIRVDIEKLDKLLDLVGELVIAEAMVANDQDIRGLNLDRFEKSVLRLDKITREIQEVAMSMRMIPLAGTFRKMMRLVRDLANKADKKVELQIIGEETEVDKTIIEQISDPLVHLIRNAVDHGLESPEERRLTGKPETGRITVEAKHSAGEVWIIVEDDGRGLNRERILSKGVERGLVKGEDRELKDEEVWQLVFEPGFSTSEQVSSISGRGVGMDVVKRNIEKLRGRVDVRSKEGAGSVFAIRIPLTLAIIEGLVVRVGMNRYTIPISSVKESFQPRAEQITSMPDGQEVVKIRGDLLPVIRLHELYRAPQAFGRLTDGILIVVESNQEKYCLFVDELVGQQQIVIKGLSTYFGRVRGVSGCAILGDGDISMILDIADLISSVEVVQEH